MKLYLYETVPNLLYRQGYLYASKAFVGQRFITSRTAIMVVSGGKTMIKSIEIVILYSNDC